MKTLLKRDSRTHQVKFNDVTGFCKLRNLVTRKEIEFAGVSELLNYCRQNDIEIAIEDCIVSNVKNY